MRLLGKDKFVISIILTLSIILGLTFLYVNHIENNLIKNEISSKDIQDNDNHKKEHNSSNINPDQIDNNSSSNITKNSNNNNSTNDNSGTVIKQSNINTSSKNKESNNSNVKSPTSSKPKLKPGTYSVDLLMVGDALIHEAVYEDARIGNEKYDFKPMLERIKPISSKQDLAYYNQETILGGKEFGYSGSPMFNSPYEVGDAFVDAGFNIVSLANNHTLDKGEQAIKNSVNYWKGKNVAYSGQAASFKEKNNIPIYSKNGVTYAFLSYTTLTNGKVVSQNKAYLLNVYSSSLAKSDIDKIKDKVDFVIVAMHWGDEYTHTPNASQKKIAKELASYGADIVIGTHPHVVQPIEYINKTLVIYSLGNFISDQKGIEKQTGLMVKVTLGKNIDDENNVTKFINNPTAELTYTYSNKSKKRNFKIYPYNQLNNNILENHEYYYNYFKEIVNSRSNKILWGIK